MRFTGRFILFAVFVLILATACSLLSPPEGPVIPTPPVAEPVDFSDLELITNPVSSVAPAVDPDIAALVNSVSEQQ